MSNENNVVVQSSFPIFGILGIVFVTLKLLGHITWPWWLVTAPFWGPFVLGVLIFVVGFLFVFGAAIIDGLRK